MGFMPTLLSQRYMDTWTRAQYHNSQVSALYSRVLSQLLCPQRSHYVSQHTLPGTNLLELNKISTEKRVQSPALFDCSAIWHTATDHTPLIPANNTVVHNQIYCQTLAQSCISSGISWGPRIPGTAICTLRFSSCACRMAVSRSSKKRSLMSSPANSCKLNTKRQIQTSPVTDLPESTTDCVNRKR